MENTQSFDTDAALDAVVEQMEQKYHKQVDKYETRVRKKHGTSPKTGTYAKKYSDEQIKSYRAACIAHAEVKPKQMTLNMIANMHGLSKPYACMLREDYTQRANCLPTQELIQKYIDKFRVGNAAVQTIKAHRPSNKLNPDEVRVIDRARKALTWTTFLKHCKRAFREYPTNWIECVMMIETLYENQCLTKEAAYEALDMMKKELPPVEALRGYNHVES